MLFMKKLLKFTTIAFVVILSCQTKPVSLSDQLKTNLINHLEKIDSTVVLDSFKILRIDTIDKRMERIIDDSIYLREFARVQGQYVNALIKGERPDSIEFYKGEVDYMLTQFDSLNREILNADTTRKLGLAVVCRTQLRKNSSSQELMLYYFLDFGMRIWDSEMIDSSIATAARRLD
jgi:hypothetical protein